LFSGYIARDTWFDRLDARTRLAWLMVVAVLAVGARGLAEMGLLAGAVVIVHLLSGRGPRPAGEMTLTFLPFLLVVCILKALVVGDGPPLLEVGPFAFRLAGAMTGLAAVGRLYVVALASLQFVSWTHPTDLALILVALRLPYRYALLVGLGLRFLPVMADELRGIYAAQEARGLDLRGPARRALAFVPVLVPLCLRTLRRANEVSLAMELRAFGLSKTRTFSREPGFARADAAVAAFLIVLMGVRLIA
jgi:energy-coupling factor transport system permease protein